MVESFVHLCAAGYGPKEVTIFFVDPDKANGNYTRTSQLLHKYISCRQNLSSSAKDKLPLFKTELRTPKRDAWHMFDDKDTETLSSHIDFISQNNDYRNLIKILFTQKELDTNLNEGFRGHPSIGAVAMSNVDYTTDPWKNLDNAIKESEVENDVRVFLVGSIFGGTGAAGVPTFGSKKIIKYCDAAIMPEKEANKPRSKVFLGGALVVPYFTFDLAGSENEKGIYVKPEDFAVATKAALYYYSEKALKKPSELGFDQVYFIGATNRPNVGKFSPGRKEQANDPHYVEIETALAANDFFVQSSEELIGDKYLISAKAKGPFTWDSFPVVCENIKNADEIKQDRRKALKDQILRMTIMSYAMCAYVPLQLKKAGRDKWFSNKCFKGKAGREEEKWNLLQDMNIIKRKDYEQYFTAFLTWICGVSENDDVRLINSEKIMKDKEILPYSPTSKNVAQLLPDANESDKTFNYLIGLLNELTESHAYGENAVERMMALLNSATDQFTSKVY